MRQVFAVVALLLVGLQVETDASQSAWGANELTEYRLSIGVFKQFEHASRRIAVATRDEPRFIRAPLFTKEVVLSGELQETAVALEARLTHEPLLASALREAEISAHDYTKFALVLFAARFAHGFVEAGVLRRVPDGAAADNVKFVAEHKAEIVDILREIGVGG
jgi:hypothetical protein